MTVGLLCWDFVDPFAKLIVNASAYSFKKKRPFIKCINGTRMNLLFVYDSRKRSFNPSMEASSSL